MISAWSQILFFQYWDWEVADFLEKFRSALSFLWMVMGESVDTSEIQGNLK